SSPSGEVHAARAMSALDREERHAAPLVASPRSLSLSADATRAVRSQVVALHAAGRPAVGWRATVDAPWLQLSAASGTSPSRLAVRVDPAGLDSGLHEARIQLTPGDGGPALTIPVRLTVAARLDMIAD